MGRPPPAASRPKERGLIIVVGALLLPALLIATWIRIWFVRRSRRWLYFFPAGLAAVILIAAVTLLTPKAPCTSSVPIACVDDVTLFGVGETLTSSLTWVVLLAITGVVELVRHLAYIARLRPTTDESPGDQRR
jgi:hypothetical protein